MRASRLFVSIIGLAAFSCVANASIVACSATGQAASVFQGAQYQGADNGCSIGDKVFANFAFAGTIDPNTLITIFSQAGNNYNVQVGDTNGGGLTTSFTMTYDIFINESLSPNPGNYYIVAVGGGMQANSLAPNNANLLKSVNAYTDALSGSTNVPSSGSGNLTVSQVGSTQTAGTITGLSASALHVTDSYTYTAGTILTFNNQFAQADLSLPEPGTMFLMGGALVGLGMIARKRRNVKA